MAHNADKFHVFMKGFMCGASYGVIEAKLAEHSDPEIVAAWDEGYRCGKAARTAAQKGAANLYDYTPSVLRIQNDG